MSWRNPSTTVPVAAYIVSAGLTVVTDVGVDVANAGPRYAPGITMVGNAAGPGTSMRIRPFAPMPPAPPPPIPPGSPPAPPLAVIMPVAVTVPDELRITTTP